MKKPIIASIVFTILLLFIGYKNLNTKKEIEEYFYISDTITQLASLNNEINFFNNNLIKHNNFDIIEKNLENTKKTLGIIEHSINTRHINNQEFIVLFQNILENMENKIQLTQSIKSHNAIINNSYRYLKKIKPQIQKVAYDTFFIQISDLDKSLDVDFESFEEATKHLKSSNKVEESFLIHSKIIYNYYKEYHRLKTLESETNLNQKIKNLGDIYTAFAYKNIEKATYLVIVLFILLFISVIMFLFDSYQIYTNNISVNRFSKAIEGSNNIVMITDAQQNIKYVNQAYTESTGYTLAEVLGKNPRVVQSGQNAKTFYKKLNRTIYSGKKWSGTFINKSKEGKKQYEKSTITPIFDTSGKIIEFVALKIDITKEIDAQNALREKEKKIFQEAKMTSLGEMLHNIAHHWRQPLSVISTVATSVSLQHEMKILTDEKLLKGMDNINNTAQHLSLTIEDFASFFVMDKPKEYFMVDSIIQRTLNLGNVDFHTLKFIVDTSLVSPIKMYGYDSELIQAILSILTNAKDILIHKDAKIIQIKASEMEDYIYLTIHDSGGGIPEEFMKKIFEPYFTTKHKSQGTGMGLYSAYTIITNRMNGEITVANEEFIFENQHYFGAKFIFKLPKNG